MADPGNTPLTQWALTISLIFIGCCANAYFLEQATRLQPSCGTLLTFLQFLGTTLQTLPTQFAYTKSDGLRFKHPAIPLSRWSFQVILYFLTTIFNNTAFSFHVPVPVHIIFRSGGLVVNMILGYFFKSRKYNRLQIVSVVLVTGGVIVSTLATTPASCPGKSSTGGDGPTALTYFMGILLLFFALILSGLMGLYQELTFEQYGSQHWQEGLFYNHVLSMPLFALRSGTLKEEWDMATTGNRLWIGWGAPGVKDHIKALSWGLQGHKEQTRQIQPTMSAQAVYDIKSMLYQSLDWKRPTLTAASGIGFLVPVLFPSLILNVLTQLLCINGVNRLTSMCSSLTVTLVLVVRKAISLAISVLILAPARGEEMHGKGMLAAGAASVLLGTIGYTIGSSSGSQEAGQDKKKKEDEATGSGDGGISTSVEKRKVRARQR